MIKIKAKIKLFDGLNSRKVPIGSGYRPLFNFVPEMKISGQITMLTNKELIHPGEEGIVEIWFVTEGAFGNNLKSGGKFTFGEGKYDKGEGEVIEVIS